MPFDFSQVDHLAADLAAAPAKVMAAAAVEVGKTAQQISEDAKGLAPVLTGELRDSISASSSGLSATVTAAARYAAYVEYGTSDTAPQPYMRPAADQGEGKLADGLLDAASRIL